MALYSSKGQNNLSDKAIHWGISGVFGETKSSSKNSSAKLSYGFGVLSYFKINDKLKGTVDLNYDLKREHFKDIKNYTINSVGELESINNTINKNYGLLSLKFNAFYQLKKINRIYISAFGGLGLYSLFWLKTIIKSPVQDDISNGKTQYKYNSPFTQPVVTTGVSFSFPFDKNKRLLVSPGYSFFYKTNASAKKTPVFNSLNIQSTLIF